MTSSLPNSYLLLSGVVHKRTSDIHRSVSSIEEAQGDNRNAGVKPSSTIREISKGYNDMLYR